MQSGSSVTQEWLIDSIFEKIDAVNESLAVNAAPTTQKLDAASSASASGTSVLTSANNTLLLQPVTADQLQAARTQLLTSIAMLELKLADLQNGILIYTNLLSQANEISTNGVTSTTTKTELQRQIDDLKVRINATQAQLNAKKAELADLNTRSVSTEGLLKYRIREINPAYTF